VRALLARIPRAAATLVGATAGAVRHGLSRTYLAAENWVVGAKHAVYGLAVGRILLGLMFLGFALTNWNTRAYTFGPGAAWSGQLQYPMSDFAAIWPISLVTGAGASDAGITIVFVLLIVLSILFTLGYRTKLVMVPLFVLWIGVVNINLYVQDQSDNLTRMALLLLFFTAPAEKWSLDARRRARFSGRDGGWLLRLWRAQPVLPSWWSNTFHNFGVVAIGAQLCMIYAAGGLFKAAGLPWQNGTAVYAPIQTAQFGTWPVLSDLVTAWGPIVGIGTIMTVLVQVSFPLLLLRRGTRIFGLLVILAFHLAIALLMGLPFFSLSMVALDAIFIRDVTWKGLADRVRGAWKGSAVEAAPPEALVVGPQPAADERSELHV